MQNRNSLGRFISIKTNNGSGLVTVECKGCSHPFTTHLSKIALGWGKYCSKECYVKHMKGRKVWNKGIPRTKEVRQKLKIANLGKKASSKTRMKMAESHKGEKSHLWKGGISLNRDRSRGGVTNQIWREKVFKRDDFKCVLCGVITKIKENIWIVAHHIESYNCCIKKRYWLRNGVTLCNHCHDSFHRKYGKGNNTRQQYLEFKKHYETR